MPVLCAIPGLIWPDANLSEILRGTAQAQALPGLAALLTQARVQHDAPCSLDRWLTQQFGLSGSAAPLAAIRRAGECKTPDTSETIWVCADPVSLRFARQHLLLDGPDTLELQADEKTALLADLNTHFSDVGDFSGGALLQNSAHIYLALAPAHADKLSVTLSPLADVQNRPVSQFQPSGEHAQWWSRLANELQVFCHNHPVNTAREARRAPALNALWLWGAGRTPTSLSTPARPLPVRLESTQPLLRGLAQLTQTDITPLDPHKASDWMLIDALHAPAQQRDIARWWQALQKLDTDILQPLAEQVRTRKIEQLSLIAPGDTALTRIDIRTTPRWKIWQRSATLPHILTTLSSPPA